MLCRQVEGPAMVADSQALVEGLVTGRGQGVAQGRLANQEEGGQGMAVHLARKQQAELLGGPGRGQSLCPSFLMYGWISGPKATTMPITFVGRVPNGVSTGAVTAPRREKATPANAPRERFSHLYTKLNGRTYCHQMDIAK